MNVAPFLAPLSPEKVGQGKEVSGRRQPAIW